MYQKWYPIILLFMMPFAVKSQMQCLNIVNIALVPDGTATISTTDLLASSPNSNSTYSLSKSNFTCADIGAPQTVTLYELRGGISYDTCFIIVNVEDKFFPPICTSLSL